MRSQRIGASGLRLTVVGSAEEATFAALQRLMETVARPRACVGLATGGTFAPMFRSVVNAHENGSLDLRNVTFTHLDEYTGIDPDTPGGMVHELREALFAPLGTGYHAFHPVPAQADDPVTEHLALLDELGPLDLQFLGVGRNGHVAFNEPGTSFVLRSHVTRLADDTAEANAARFPTGAHPESAVTMGPRGILDARKICLVAIGDSKAAAVRAMLEGPISPQCPASVVRLHSDAEVILDEAAAAHLSEGVWASPETCETAVLDSQTLDPQGPVVVISPHPDDASISCGGLLVSLPAGTSKHIVTMTTGSRAQVPGDLRPDEVTDLRESEVQQEARILGCGTSFLRCRYYDSGVFERTDVDALIAELERLSPAWVLAPSLDDPHPTHRLSRQVLDAALEGLNEGACAGLEVWTFEGAWYQHAPEDVNALVTFHEDAEDLKLRAVRAHASQLARVPFDEGAKALARLRAVTFSESHFGGSRPGALTRLPLVEALVPPR